MSAGKHDFVIEAGTDWQRNIYLKDDAGAAKNITGYTAAMDIRETIDGPKVESLAVGTGITIDGPAGKITLDLADTETIALNIKQGVYDLILTSSGGTKSKLLEGKITVTPIVTRT